MTNYVRRLRDFQRRRRIHAMLSHDHAKIDRVERFLFAHALVERQLFGDEAVVESEFFERMKRRPKKNTIYPTRSMWARLMDSGEDLLGQFLKP